MTTETEFAKQQAEYQNRKEVLIAGLMQMGKELITETESLPPDKWPKGLVPQEAKFSEKLIPPQK